METPAVPGMLPGMQTPEMYQAARAERELWERNKPLTDEELDALLPGTDQVCGEG
jgi:splicing factor 3B subunit 1